MTAADRTVPSRDVRGVGLFAVLAYALPAAATQFILAPFSTVAPGVYVTHFGIDAATMGVALLVMRIADAVTDPLVGHLSDRTRSRIGPRKPWLIAGAILTMAAGWLVLSPLGTPTAAGLILWSVLFFLGWTMMEIPHAAWGAELSREPTARTTVFFLRAACGVAGGTAFAALPFLPVFESTAISPRTLSAAALAFCFIAPLTVAVAVVFAPARGRA